MFPFDAGIQIIFVNVEVEALHKSVLFFSGPHLVVKSLTKLLSSLLMGQGRTRDY